MAKKITFVFFIGVFFVINIEASVVSFFIIESGLPAEMVKNQHSQQWENAFFDVFFDAGHIVCNAPMIRIDSKPKMSIEKFVQDEMDEAKQGGAEFLIVAQLDFSGDSMAPREISLILFKITPYKLIHERKITGKSYKSEKEELDDLKNIVKGLIPRINEI
jgi:hypothetical protein